MPRSYQLFDLELAPYVTNWGQVEEIKDVLLAQSQLFTSQHTLVLSNQDGRFSPYITKSPFYGRNTQLEQCTLSVDGTNLFSGYVRSIEPDQASRTVNIIAENAFTIPANSIINLTTSGNPASILQTIFENVGLGQYLDLVSFAAAGSGASAAGATIAVAYATSAGTTALSAVQSICALCSFSCFVQGGLIRLRAFQPYQGNLAGVKWAVTSAIAYDFKNLVDAYTNLSNSVNIDYGASSTLYLANQASIRLNGIETNTPFSTKNGSTLSVPDITSATYFGGLFLDRASTLRKVGTFTGGPQMVEAHIGDRITVAASNWSTSPVAFEIIETHLTVASNSVEIVCATI